MAVLVVVLTPLHDQMAPQLCPRGISKFDMCLMAFSLPTEYDEGIPTRNSEMTILFLFYQVMVPSRLSGSDLFVASLGQKDKRLAAISR